MKPDKENLQFEDLIASVRRHSVLQGYFVLAVGIILLFFSLGYLKILNWIIAIASLLLIVWGLGQSNLIDVMRRFFDYFMSLFRRK